MTARSARECRAVTVATAAGVVTVAGPHEPAPPDARGGHVMDDTRRRDLLLATVAASLLPTAPWSADPAVAQPAGGGDASDGGLPRPGEAWAASWAASVQGPYPVGNPSAQPDQRFAFPVPAEGADDQTLRLVLRPTLWGRQARLRFSNAFGTRPLNLDGAFVGLHLGGGALVPGTNRPLRFGGGREGVTVPPGGTVWSDPVDLPFAADPASPLLAGRKLAVSFHVVGRSGPMTWHAKALQTSYVTAPGAGSKGGGEGEAGVPFSTTSWYFLDALEMAGPPDGRAVVAFGDSITDGTNSTLNGDDRWPDGLGRRLQALHGKHVAVVNAGIGGNRVVGPAESSPSHPFSGGPSALARLE